MPRLRFAAVLRASGLPVNSESGREAARDNQEADKIAGRTTEKHALIIKPRDRSVNSNIVEMSGSAYPFNTRLPPMR
jgi:hypothetical protein